jgi:hypothetical protein
MHAAQEALRRETSTHIARLLAQDLDQPHQTTTDPTDHPTPRRQDNTEGEGHDSNCSGHAARTEPRRNGRSCRDDTTRNGCRATASSVTPPSTPYLVTWTVHPTAPSGAPVVDTMPSITHAADCSRAMSMSATCLDTSRRGSVSPGNTVLRQNQTEQVSGRGHWAGGAERAYMPGISSRTTSLTTLPSGNTPIVSTTTAAARYSCCMNVAASFSSSRSQRGRRATRAQQSTRARLFCQFQWWVFCGAASFAVRGARPRAWTRQRRGACLSYVYCAWVGACCCAAGALLARPRVMCFRSVRTFFGGGRFPPTHTSPTHGPPLRVQMASNLVARSRFDVNALVRTPSCGCWRCRGGGDP